MMHLGASQIDTSKLLLSNHHAYLRDDYRALNL